MTYPMWHTCLRLSGLAFPIASIGLFFAPRGTTESALLAVTAIASAGVWAFCSSHRQSPPDTQSVAEAEGLTLDSLEGISAAGAPAVQAVAKPAVTRMQYIDEDDTVDMNFALGDQLFHAASHAARPVAAPAAPVRAANPDAVADTRND